VRRLGGVGAEGDVMATEIADAMGVDLTGMGRVPSERLSVMENAQILARLAGSGRAAARALGVAESTLRGWRRGVQPRTVPTSLVTLGRALAVQSNRPEHMAQVMAGGRLLTIRGVVVVSGDARLRTIHPGRDIPLVKIRNIVRAWAAGQDDRVDRLTVNAINHHYAPGMDIGSVEWVTFE
jgi:hypothetical protein